MSAAIPERDPWPTLTTDDAITTLTRLLGACRDGTTFREEDDDSWGLLMDAGMALLVLAEAATSVSSPHQYGSNDNPHESDGTPPEACTYCGDVWPCAGSQNGRTTTSEEAT